MADIGFGPKPVSFLTATICFSMSGGVLLGDVFGLLDFSFKPAMPSFRKRLIIR